MLRYDFEAHFYIPEFTGKFSRQMFKNTAVPDKMASMLNSIIDIDENRIADMDKNGVDVQVLSFSSGLAELPAEEAVALSRLANDRLYAAMQKYPGRFAGFAQLPEQDPKEACRELERCMNELGFFGWNTFSNFGDSHLDDPQYFPILEKAAELGAVIYLHPDAPIKDPRFQGLGGQVMGSLGFTLDTTLTVIRLICSGVFDKLPNLKLILGHLGEGIPFYLDRLCSKTDNVKQRYPAINEHGIQYYFEHNIWMTNSGNLSEPAFRCAKEVVGLDRILFGSDYPYECLEQAVRFTDNLQLSHEELEAVYSENARAAFPQLF